MRTIIPIAAKPVSPTFLSKKNDGTPMSAASEKHTSCRFVRLKMNLLFTFVRSRGTDMYDANISASLNQCAWSTLFAMEPDLKSVNARRNVIATALQREPMMSDVNITSCMSIAYMPMHTMIMNP